MFQIVADDRQRYLVFGLAPSCSSDLRLHAKSPDSMWNVLPTASVKKKKKMFAHLITHCDFRHLIIVLALSFMLLPPIPPRSRVAHKVEHDKTGNGPHLRQDTQCSRDFPDILDV
jgi:hypothetical protein